MSGFSSGISNVLQGNTNWHAAANAGNAKELAYRGAEGENARIYSNSNQLFQPYYDAGTNAIKTLGSEAGPTGSLGRQFTRADFAADPAYQWDLQQGMNAINNSNSVRGGALSGGAMKALTNYATQQASNEFGNARDYFTRNQNQNFGQLSDLAGTGMRAAGAQAQLGEGYVGRDIALRTGIGNIQADTILGKAAAQNQQTAGGMSAMNSLAMMAMGS